MVLFVQSGYRAHIGADGGGVLAGGQQGARARATRASQGSPARALVGLRLGLGALALHPSKTH